MNNDLIEIRARAIKEAQRANRRHLSPEEIVQIIEEAEQAAGYRVVKDWQPVETAPRDGSEFIARYARQGNVMKLVSYNRTHGYFQCKGKWLPGFLVDATHWMPKPPIDTAGGEHERD